MNGKICDLICNFVIVKLETEADFNKIKEYAEELKMNGIKALHRYDTLEELRKCIVENEHRCGMNTPITDLIVLEYDHTKGFTFMSLSEAKRAIAMQYYDEIITVDQL